MGDQMAVLLGAWDVVNSNSRMIKVNTVKSSYNAVEGGEC